MFETRSKAKKRKQLRGRKYRIDSFDRFGDDLCQLLLSYLSIKDKIRFECISKQWQRLVFNTQTKLLLNPNIEDSIQYFLMTKELWKNRIKVYETLFKKFKFVKEIQLQYSGDDSHIDLMTNYCQNLEKVRFCVLGMNASYESFIQSGQRFAQKFANTLKDIYVDDRDSILIQFIKPLARNLTVNTGWTSIEELIDFDLIKLKQINETSPQSMTQMKAFSDMYCERIEKLGLTLRINDYSVNDALKELSRFKNLKDLELVLFNSDYEQELSIDNELRSIAKNCNQIKKLGVRFICGSIDGKLLQVFGAFKALEQISINFSEKLKGRIGNIDFLKNCQNLKSLKLIFYRLRDSFYKDIDIHLPQLKSIEFNCSEKLSYHCVNDKTLENLAKMQNLIKLSINCKKITISGIEKLIKNSPQIKTIHSNDRTISKRTIDAFIERANQNEKIKYQFIPSDSKYKVMISIIDKIPHNLSVKKLEK